MFPYFDRKLSWLVLCHYQAAKFVARPSWVEGEALRIRMICCRIVSLKALLQLLGMGLNPVVSILGGLIFPKRL